MSSDSLAGATRNPYLAAVSRLLPHPAGEDSAASKNPATAGPDTDREWTATADDPIDLSLRLALIRLRNARPTRGPSSWEPTVSALCREAGVARSTFYGHYHTADDVLRDLEDRTVSDLLSLNALSMDKSSGASFIDSTARYIRRHRTQFQALLVSQPDWRFIDLWKAAIKYHFWQRLFGTEQTTSVPATSASAQQTTTLRTQSQRVHPVGNRGLVLEIVAGTVVSGFTYLLRQPDTTSWADLGTLVELSLSSLDTVR